jgi:hypothetical protein
MYQDKETQENRMLILRKAKYKLLLRKRIVSFMPIVPIEVKK